MYSLFEQGSFLKDLRKFYIKESSKEYVKLKAVVYPKLKENPFFDANIKKLGDCMPDTWRYRLGNSRLFYMVNEDQKEVYLMTFKTRIPINVGSMDIEKKGNIKL